MAASIRRAAARWTGLSASNVSVVAARRRAAVRRRLDHGNVRRRDAMDQARMHVGEPRRAEPEILHRVRLQRAGLRRAVQRFPASDDRQRHRAEKVVGHQREVGPAAPRCRKGTSCRSSEEDRRGRRSREIESTEFFSVYPPSEKPSSGSGRPSWSFRMLFSTWVTRSRRACENGVTFLRDITCH